jgi:glycosyltransferase involved in cell wall biosynthesis
MTLRVLHLISSPASGGAEVYAKDLTMEFLRQGAFGCIGFLSKASDIGRSAEYELKFLADLDAAQIPYFFVGHEARRNPLLGAWRVRQFCIEHRIDVYHSHLKYGIAYGTLLSIPRVHTHHNILPRVGRTMYSLFNLFVDAYVGISAVCAERLAESTGRQVTTICNGVDPKKILPHASGPRTFAVPLQCIAVGTIQPQKNYKLLVDAVALLSAEARAAIRVSIVGEGPAERTAELRAQIADKHLEDTIVLLGNRVDVPELLGRSHLFLMSSAWEGFPIALIEAALSGLPCIVTDVGGCAELVNVCGNGVVVPPQNASALAAAIECLVREPEQLAELSRNAVQKSGAFDIRVSAEQHLALYRRLLLRN